MAQWEELSNSPDPYLDGMYFFDQESGVMVGEDTASGNWGSGGMIWRTTNAGVNRHRCSLL